MSLFPQSCHIVLYSDFSISTHGAFVYQYVAGKQPRHKLHKIPFDSKNQFVTTTFGLYFNECAWGTEEDLGTLLDNRSNPRSWQEKTVYFPMQNRWDLKDASD